MALRLGYHGNPQLLTPNMIVQLTQVEIDEYLKCMNNPVYFIKNYVTIVEPGVGLIKFLLRKYQQSMIEAIENNRFTIGLWPRQYGKSTTMCAYMLHQVLFNENFTIALICDKKELAKDLLARIKLAYEYLPNFLKQAIVSWNKGDIEFLNGSKVKTFAAGGRGVAGQSIDLLYLDEFAHVKNTQAEAFYAGAYPVVSQSKTSKIVITSTPAGKNMFYDFWEKAKAKINQYFPIKVEWWDMAGRDEKWKKEQLMNMTEQQFNVEFGCQFLGSTSILIDSFKLSEIRRKILGPIVREQDFDVYEIPQQGHSYVLTVDVAEGQNKDYSAFCVIDVSEIPYKQVAKYRCKTITPMLYPSVIFNVARKYNDAHILVEINSIGLQVASVLYNDFGYENIVRINPRSPGGPGQYATFFFNKGSQLGLKTSVQTKRIGCANLKTLIETDKLIINDMDTLLELETFAVKDKSYAAEEGNHDDLVMTLVMFSWLANQQEFKNYLDNDVRKFLEDEKINVNDKPFFMIRPSLNSKKIDPYNLDWKQDYNLALEQNTIEIDKDGDLWVPVDDMSDNWKYGL